MGEPVQSRRIMLQWTSWWSDSSIRWGFGGADAAHSAMRICRGCTRDVQNLVANLDLGATTNELCWWAPWWWMLSSRIHPLYVGNERLFTDGKLCTSLPTKNSRSIGIYHFGSNWFILTMHIMGQMGGLETFLEECAHRHMWVYWVVFLKVCLKTLVEVASKQEGV